MNLHLGRRSRGRTDLELNRPKKIQMFEVDRSPRRKTQTPKIVFQVLCCFKIFELKFNYK